VGVGCVGSVVMGIYRRQFLLASLIAGASPSALPVVLCHGFCGPPIAAHLFFKNARKNKSPASQHTGKKPRHNPAGSYFT